MFSSIFLKGFSVGFSLIVAIGAQNAFILKQGLKQEYVFYIVLTCIFIDTALMALGIFGLGYFSSQNALFINVIAFIGILFLCGYGLMSLYSAFKGQHLMQDDKTKVKSLKEVIIFLVMLSLLNPHVYLDTVLLIGSMGAIYESMNDKVLFFAGSAFASAVWFFSLGYGAKYLIPLFKSKTTWRVLDTFIAIVMFIIAYSLVPYLYK